MASPRQSAKRKQVDLHQGQPSGIATWAECRSGIAGTQSVRTLQRGDDAPRPGRTQARMQAH
jgi:hypothetical protein